MLDIPLQQSGILTFMSLKKLMSVQAAIVRPTHPPPPSLPPSSSCSTKRKCFISTIGSAVTKITLYSVKTVYRDFEGERTQFFLLLMGDIRAPRPRSHPYQPCCLATDARLCPLLSLVTCLLWGTSVKPPAVCWGEGFPLHSLPPLKAKKSTAAKLGEWWAVVSHHKWHRHSCVLTDVPLKLVEGEPTDSSCRFCHPARAHKRIHWPYVRVCVSTSL